MQNVHQNKVSINYETNNIKELNFIQDETHQQNNHKNVKVAFTKDKNKDSDNKLQENSVEQIVKEKQPRKSVFKVDSPTKIEGILAQGSFRVSLETE